MKPPALTPVEARLAIDLLLEAPGTLRLTSHVRQRMKDRQFTVDDILRVLRQGTVASGAEWDEVRGLWRYRVAHRDLGGEPLTLIIAIEEHMTVITGYA